MKITTDFIGSESRAETRNRIAAIASFYGVTAPQTWGNIRAGLNPFLPVPIANGELAGSFLPKINSLNRGGMHWLNDLGGVVMWYDPSDLSTLFQDRTGSVPVTAPGQLVGVQLDKGKNLARGPELTINGDFSAGTTGWVDGGTSALSVVSGALRNTSTITGVGARVVRQTYSGLVIGKTYEVIAEIKGSGGSGARQPRLEIRQGLISYLASPVYPDSPGPMRLVFVAAATVHDVWLRYDSTSGDLTTYMDFDNVSVRELPGFHKTAINDAARGTLMRHPASGVRNLANGSANVESTLHWPVSNALNGITLTKVGSGLDVDGLPYVDVRYQGTSTGTIHDRAYTSSFGRTSAEIGQTYTASCVARVVGGSLSGVTGLRISCVEENAPGTYVNETNGVPVTSSSDTETIATRTLVSGNQVRVAAVLVFPSGGTIDVTYRIKALQFERGPSRTAFQASLSPFDITEAGVPDVWCIRTDGLNTGYVTPTVTPGTDKAQVFAAVRKLSDAARGVVVSLGEGTDGRIAIDAPAGASDTHQLVSRGTSTVFALAGGAAAPNTSVLTGLSDIAGDSAVLRRNGTQVANATSDQGTGNYLNQPLYFYRLASSLPANINAYGEVVRFGPPLTPAQIAQTERWLAGKCGVTL